MGFRSSYAPILRASALVALAALFAAGPRGATAQDAGKSKRVQTLAERQEKARAELEKLQQRVRDIAERLRKRGDEYQARKLEEAFSKIHELGLIPAMRAAAQTLQDARLWEAADQQKEVLSKIDKILDILLDRKNYEELNSNAKELEKIEKNIDELIDRQESHIKEAERIEKEGRDAIPQDVKEAAARIEELRDRQRALMRRTQEADVGEELERVNRAIEEIDRITEDQENLLKGVQGVKGLTAQEAKSLLDALKDMEKLLSAQAMAAKAASEKGAAPDLKDLARALEAAKNEQAGLDKANADESRQAGKTGLAEALADLQSLKERQKQVKHLTMAAGELEALAESQAEIAKRAGKDPAWAAEHERAQAKAADRLKSIADDLAQAQPGQMGEEDWKNMRRASEAASRASEALRNAARAAKGDSQEASKKAEEARKAVAEAASALAPLTGKNWEKLNAAQQELAKKARELSGDVGERPTGADVDPASIATRKDAAQALEKAAEKMDAAVGEIKNKNSGEATGRQKEAEGALAMAMSQINSVLQKATPGTRELSPGQQNLAQKTGKLSSALDRASERVPLGSKGEVGEKVRRAASQADKAAQEQTAASRALSRGDNHAAAKAQQAANERLSKAAQALAEAQQAAAGRPGREDLAQAEKMIAKAADDLSKNVGKVSETLGKRDAKDRASEVGDVSKALSEAARAANQAASSAKSGQAQADRTAQKSAQALEQVQKARQALDDFLKKSRPSTEMEAKAQAELTSRSGRVTQALNQIARNSHASSPERAQMASGAASSARKATDKMSHAARELDKNDPRTAEESQKKALKDLAEARAKAEGLRRRLVEKNEPLRKEVVEKQEALDKETQELAKRLKDMASKSQGAKSASASKASKSTQKASQSMQKSAQQIVNRNFPKTKQEQQQAVKALEEARRAIKEMENAAIREKMERALNALIREQAGTSEKSKLTEKELEKLARLMEARKMNRASSAMDQAKHKVSKMEIVPGKKKMEEARDYLKQAKKDVQEQQRRYHQAAQEQLLFQIKTMLKEILDEQKKINGLIDEMGARTDKGDRLLRSNLRALYKAADEEEKLAARMSEIEKKIEGQAKVYAWVIKSVGEDMRSIADLLRDRPPDVSALTRGLARETVERIQELLEAFKLELKKRQDPKQQKPKPSGGGGKPRLVPPLAELQMLRTYQGQIRNNTEKLIEQIREGKQLTPVQRMILERLHLRQGNVVDVMRNFLKSLTGEGPEGSRR